MRAVPRVFLVLAMIGACFALAVPASAHAALVGSSPSPGSVIGTSPGQIVITFSEPVRPVDGHVQVIAPDGTRISGTPTVSGVTLRIPVRKAAKPLGTYLVSYRVISADTHPVGGALTFSVGAPSSRPQPPASGNHLSVAAAIPTFHFLTYAGLVLSIGPALFLALLWPRRRPRHAPIRLVRAGLALIAAGTLGGLWTQAPSADGTALWTTSWPSIRSVLLSPYGATLIARLALLLLVTTLVGPVLRGTATRGRALAAGVVSVAGLVTWPLTGHAGASPLAAAIVAADVIHITSMSVWLGGLVTLIGFLLRGTSPRVLGVILPVWSRWAALAVVWLIAGGLVQAVVQVGSFGALFHTPYGRLLLAKAGILVATLAVAAYARGQVQRTWTRRVEPAPVPERALVLVGAPASPEPSPGIAWDPSAGVVRRMRRAVGIEVVATVAVLAISAVLVQVNPGRTAGTGQPAAQAEGVSQTLSSSLYTLQFNIYPVELGDNNTIHAFLYTSAGAPLPAQQWTVTSQLLGGRDLEPDSEPLLPLVPANHAGGAITFPFAGTYRIEFTIRTTAIDEATVTTTVTVR